MDKMLSLGTNDKLWEWEDIKNSPWPGKMFTIAVKEKKWW